MENPEPARPSEHQLAGDQIAQENVPADCDVCGRPDVPYRTILGPMCSRRCFDAKWRQDRVRPRQQALAKMDIVRRQPLSGRQRWRNR